MECSTLPLPNPFCLTQVIVRPVLPHERERWDTLMRQHHYLGFSGMIGASLRYVAVWKDQWLALIGWQAAALKCKPRDHWIGWPPHLHYQRLYLIANNCRFLILPHVQLKNLASCILSKNIKRLSADWNLIHGHPLLLAETFVDPSRFTGTCYRAANWQQLGLTRGFAKHQMTYTQHHQPKWVFVYPLHKKAKRDLANPHTPTRSPKTMNPKILTNKQLQSLHQRIRQARDCRKPQGIRHRYHTVLTLALAAVLCGAKSFVAIGEFASQLTQEGLKGLGARFDQKTGRFQPPSEPTLRRVLQNTDADAMDALLGSWFLEQEKQNDPIAVDGKTLRGARQDDGTAIHLLSAFLHQMGTTVGQVNVPRKTNEIPEIKNLLRPLPIPGRVVTADAMHTQRDTATYLVEEKKAHYLFTVKENQKGLRDDIAALQSGDFSPCVHSGR